MVNVNTSNSNRESAIQGGNSTADAILDQTRAITTGASVVVYRIRFTSSVTASVIFQLFWNGGPSPIFPQPLDGGAVYDAGVWKVDTATGCGLAVGAGYPCGNPNARPLTTDTVPKG